MPFRELFLFTSNYSAEIRQAIMAVSSNHTRFCTNQWPGSGTVRPQSALTIEILA